MDNAWITGALLLVIIYYLMTRYKKKSMITPVVYTDILDKEEYKVKGQWEK